jgi:hypothetical protein
VTFGAHARHRLRPVSHLVLPERLRASCPFLTRDSFYACKRLLSACKVRRAARAEPMIPSMNGTWPSGSVAELKVGASGVLKVPEVTVGAQKVADV